MKDKLICHVCGKEKKPYTVFIKNDSFSLIHYQMAREKGEICERCDRYYAMTSEFKDATEEEFDDAKKSVEFARLLSAWWEKDKKLDIDNNETNSREWEGTHSIANWCRKHLKSKRGRK